jgi:hypothetical protein
MEWDEVLADIGIGLVGLAILAVVALGLMGFIVYTLAA